MSTLSTIRTASTSASGRGAAPAYAFDGWSIVLGLFALSNLANGAWMLAVPVHWYEHVPAAVPDFGPLNEHFVRDIGAAFTVIGLGLAVAAVMPRWRVAACAAATAFFALHALVHVVDTLRGLVGPEHWLIDLPGVYVPAVLLAAVTWMVARTSR